MRLFLVSILLMLSGNVHAQIPTRLGGIELGWTMKEFVKKANHTRLYQALYGTSGLETTKKQYICDFHSFFTETGTDDQKTHIDVFVYRYKIYKLSIRPRKEIGEKTSLLSYLKKASKKYGTLTKKKSKSTTTFTAKNQQSYISIHISKEKKSFYLEKIEIGNMDDEEIFRCIRKNKQKKAKEIEIKQKEIPLP